MRLRALASGDAAVGRATRRHDVFTVLGSTDGNRLIWNQLVVIIDPGKPEFAAQGPVRTGRARGRAGPPAPRSRSGPKAWAGRFCAFRFGFGVRHLKLLEGTVPMSTLNATYAKRLENLGIRVPEILLPNTKVDLGTWAVVACDQYTSDRAYWETVERIVGDRPSALRLTLPEIYLDQPGLTERVHRIHGAMASYLAEGVLESRGECWVYVRRTTEHSGVREGVLMAMDLERYDYARDSKSLIRATEGTIVERIPPRLAVRGPAPLELPHIMILVDDPERSLIEGWSARVHELDKLYDVELMQGGGRLEGSAIREPAHVGEILERLERLLDRTRERQRTDQPLFWAMGDGNHSLATAKASWEAIRKRLLAEGLPEQEVLHHPARWALAEIVNVHSPALRFEPIHRAVFTGDVGKLTHGLRRDETVSEVAACNATELREVLAGPEGQDKAGYFDGQRFHLVTWKAGLGLPPGLVDGVFSHHARIDTSARIDFIHGWEDTERMAAGGAGCFFLPVLARERLFSWVDKNGPLPRKSFSMGDAQEKRFYMEARRITPQ
ncbi:MAG: DUF1015 domain-containing protein [Polyangiaceae bacterium]|nr:DUF1015 domain-containing protein [Polyangiaceae bacterium]